MKITNITYYDTESLRPLIELAYNLTWEQRSDIRQSPYKLEEVKIIVSYFGGDQKTDDGGTAYAYAKSKPTWSRDPRSVLHVALRRKNKMFDGELAHLAASRSGDLPIEASTDFVKAVMGEMTGRYQAKRIIDTLIWPGETLNLAVKVGRSVGVLTEPNSEYPGGEVTLSPIKVHARATKGSAQVWQLITSFKAWNREARNERSLLYEMECLQERVEKVKAKKLKQSHKWQKARLDLLKRRGPLTEKGAGFQAETEAASIVLANRILMDTGLMGPGEDE